jgi:AcrR family transcriptional regulator
MTAKPDGRIVRGDATRLAVLNHAAKIASVDGLDGLSIGRLAKELDASKSGVFAHFGSKEELQLATIRFASEIFAQSVIKPTFAVPPGIERVQRLYMAWLDYSRLRVFPGGCFFFAVTAEFDARTGRVHDAVAEARTGWIDLQERVITDAVQLGQLAEDTDPAQLAFELDALAMSANANSVLYGVESAYERAAAAIWLRITASRPGD